MKPPKQEQIRDLGEQGLLQLLQAFCPQEIIGDDGAILSVTDGQSLVVTTDVLVDGVHFSDRTTSATDAGWRATAANLSDLAAMGASPLGITVGLALPNSLPVAWVEGLYEGIVGCLAASQTPIVGGDVCRSPVASIAITALGEVAPQRIITRSTAQPGDVILATGLHGGSKAGLELLLHSQDSKELSSSERESLMQAHRRPLPRLDVISKLRSLWSEEITVTGMDSSDGLADAILQICQSSGVGAIVEESAIKYPSALENLVSQEEALNWALYGGEDFQLVLCFPEKIAQNLLGLLEPEAAVIGQITSSLEVKLVDSQRKKPPRILNRTEGFQHF